MDSFLHSKIIRISVGEPKNGFVCYVGQRVSAGDKRMEITRIVRDENNYHFFGKIRYLVLGVDVNSESKEEKLLRYIEGHSVMCVCDVD